MYLADGGLWTACKESPLSISWAFCPKEWEKVRRPKRYKDVSLRKDAVKPAECPATGYFLPDDSARRGVLPGRSGPGIFIILDSPVVRFIEKVVREAVNIDTLWFVDYRIKRAINVPTKEECAKLALGSFTALTVGSSRSLTRAVGVASAGPGKVTQSAGTRTAVKSLVGPSASWRRSRSQ